jgi:YVTN family beta-propeller protein
VLDYRILGPLEVSADGRVIQIGGPKLRALLVILLLRANESVPRDVLVHELWGEQPPAGAQHSLDVYVSRLRKSLDGAANGLDGAANGSVLVTRPGSYRLQVAEGQLDARRFERLVEQGRAALTGNAPGQAAASLRAALQLWRGEALADLANGAGPRVEVVRLEELRLSAIEDRIEADLALGRHAELVGELETLVTAHPLRERLQGQLMIALYQGGRQAEALEVYRAARRTLIEELGLEPGPELCELEKRILQHDPTLTPWRLPVRAAGSPPVHTDERLPVRTAGRRASRAVLAGAALLSAAILAAGLLTITRVGRPEPPHLAGTSGVVAVGVASAKLVAATPLAGAPGGLSNGAGSVWVADAGAGAVERIDPGSGLALDQIPIGGEPGSVASGGGAIWVASSVGATVTRIDPTTEGVTQTITLPGSDLSAIAFGDSGVWVADSVARELFDIDPATGSLQRTLSLDLQPSAIAIAVGAIWVTGYDDATVEEIDPGSGQTIARVHVGNGPAALATQSGSLWVANSLDATVSRIDLATRTVTATIPVGSGPTALAAATGSVWVANQYSDDVSRINPRSDQVTDSVDVDGAPTSLAVLTARLWVGVVAEGGSHRGGTLVIDGLTSNGPLTGVSIDPAFYSYANDPQFTGLEYDLLVTFQQSAGADGLRLVPDLALSIPTSADGDTTYTFRLRAGIRYSDGQPLRASDFRRGFERLFRVGSFGASLYSGIVGAAACASHPRRCSLSQGIITDDAVGTVTFRLTAPDPDFLFKLTYCAYSAPIPPGSPDRETGSRTVPGTGPYKIAAVSSTEVRFVRNPFFREWSHAAQPAGNPDSIVWQTVPTAEAAVTAIEQGRADWFFGQLPAARYRQLELTDPAQLHSSPTFAVEFVPLNTNLPPFNDVRVRQALNYAIDRAEIAGLYGGPTFAAPACQPITPGLPGYVPYCPYTLDPRPGGTWSAPDLARARQLVAESGTSGERIEVWGEPDQGYVPPTAAPYIAGVLRSLGYRVQLHMVPIATVTPAMRTHFQLSVDGDWLANYPDPSSYLPQFFGCGGGNSNGFYCNPALDREMQRAAQLESSNPSESRALWTSIDRQLTDDAVWVPTVTLREVELTSRRLGNYEYNPVWGFLADQSWVR